MLTQAAAATNRHRRSARIVNGPPVSYAQDKPYRKPYKPAEIWHEALRVHNQRTFRGQQQFHVEWAGIDPSTGGAYPFSWLNARKLSEHLRRSWEDHKARKAEADVLRLEPVPTPEQQLRLRELEDASAKYFSAPNADDDASSSSGAESPLNEEAAHHDDDDGGCSICEDPEQAEDGVLISPCCGRSRSASYAYTINQSRPVHVLTLCKPVEEPVLPLLSRPPSSTSIFVARQLTGGSCAAEEDDIQYSLTIELRNPRLPCLPTILLRLRARTRARPLVADLEVLLCGGRQGGNLSEGFLFAVERG